VVTPAYILVQLIRDQYKKEQMAWVEYISAIAERVTEDFGVEIGGDLSLLHAPVAKAAQIYFKAFHDIRRVDKLLLDKLVDLEEEGVCEDTPVLQTCAVAEDIDKFCRCTMLAHAKMKRMIAPQWGAGRTHANPSALPSALFVDDIGVKSAEEVIVQARHLHEDKLNGVINSSQLKVVFKDCDALFEGLKVLRELFEIEALVNRFANPTPMGKRSIDIVVPIELLPVDESLEHADQEHERGVPPHLTQSSFRVQIQLQLLRFEEAAREAAPQEQLFAQRLRSVCLALEPKHRPFVQEMMAQQMKIFRPSSAMVAQQTWCSNAWRMCCCSRKQRRRASRRGKADSSDSSHGHGGRACDAVVRRLAIEVDGSEIADPLADLDSAELLQEPLLMQEEEPRAKGRGLYATHEYDIKERFNSSVNGDPEARAGAVEVASEALGEAVVTEGASVVAKGEAVVVAGGGAGGEHRERELRTKVLIYEDHSAESDTLWYDLRWVLESERSNQLLLQDLMVLTKTIAASYALHFVTREDELIVCEGASYTAHAVSDCRFNSTGGIHREIREVNSTLSYGEVKHACRPHLDLSYLDEAFTGLICVNIFVFISFIGLRYFAVAYRPYASKCKALREHSLCISLFFFTFAVALAMLKVYIATSYVGKLGQRPPQIHYDTGANGDGDRAFVHLPPPLANCTSISTTGADGAAIHHSANNGGCVAALDCSPQCRLKSPAALETLCSMYIIAAFYIAYLGYDFHRALCVDSVNFSLRGRAARLAKSISPFLRGLPILAALMKYCLIVLTFGLTLTARSMIKCHDLEYDRQYNLPTPTPPTPAPPAAWISGAGKDWTFASHPGPYAHCSKYDLCTLSYASDGTLANEAGKTFVFNGPDGPPYLLTIDMKAQATFNEWRFFTGGYPKFGAGNLTVQYQTSGGFVNVSGSALTFTGSMDYGGLSNASSRFTTPITAQVWRIKADHKLCNTGDSCPFQLYMSEVQFRNDQAPARLPTPSHQPTRPSSEVLEVSGAVMSDGCHPSVEPLFTGRWYALLILMSMQLLGMVDAVTSKRFWLSSAARTGRMIARFSLFQGVLLVCIIAFLAELRSLRVVHNLPSFHCAAREPRSSFTAAAGYNSPLPTCTSGFPTPPPTLPPPPTPAGNTSNGYDCSNGTSAFTCTPHHAHDPIPSRYQNLSSCQSACVPPKPPVLSDLRTMVAPPPPQPGTDTGAGYTCGSGADGVQLNVTVVQRSTVLTPAPTPAPPTPAPPTPAPAVVTTWKGLASGVAACTTQCVFTLARGFATSADSFKRIELARGSHVTIHGEGHAVIDAHSKDHMFAVDGDAVLNVDGVALQHGKPAEVGANGGGGAVLLNVGASARFTSCKFISNSAPAGSGGAVFAHGETALGFDSCDFFNNTSGGRGGAVDIDGTAATSTRIVNCSFVSNTGTTSSGNGAGAGAVSVQGGTASMTNCSFVDNTASGGSGGAGAGALFVQGGTASMTNCSFVNNLGNTSVGGGAVFALSGSTASIAGCTFRKPAEDSKGHNDIRRCVKGQSSCGCDLTAPTAVVTFKCPAGTVGESVTMVAQDLLPTQLPPATEVVHCTPLLLSWLQVSWRARSMHR
jgi:hypothetical protein